ncbi:MAG: IclR family transcriptional regulator C-terminal domain-containing protein, partial [Rhodospirillales bacterium]|nr:IclR family transcriptional regulator C-terminal domain-containing protein [Rhodospirillales bacterium]
RSHALKLALADGLERRTNSTITTVEDFGRELDLVGERGFAMNLGEFAEGVHSIAAPIRSQRMGGVVLGAAVLTGPDFRLPEARLAEHAPALERLGVELGEILPADLVKLPFTT